MHNTQGACIICKEVTDHASPGFVGHYSIGGRCVGLLVCSTGCWRQFKRQLQDMMRGAAGAKGTTVGRIMAKAKKEKRLVLYTVLSRTVRRGS